MAVTVANLETLFNTYIGDTTTDRVSAAERLQFATEAVAWLKEETGNDHMVDTYTIDYLSNIHQYKTTTSIASLLEGADLRRAEDDQTISATNRSSRELAEDIGNDSSEFAWSIERRNGNSYLIVNLDGKYRPKTISSFDSTTAGGGTWSADTSSSDALNLTVDSREYKTGSGSLNFDIDVSQSGNNRATISNTTLNSWDLSDDEDLSSWVFWVYIPDVTEFSSVTMQWGTDTSNYWSATVTTDYNGNAFAVGWNRVAIAWPDATATGTPDETDVSYVRIDLNYTASQGDDTDFRLDDLTLVRPEKLTFHYTSWYVGTNNSGTAVAGFGATTDIPYFSAQYDQYKYSVAHKMASIAFYGPLENPQLGQMHEVEAIKGVNRVKKIIPSSVSKEVKSFKVSGINFRRRR